MHSVFIKSACAKKSCKNSNYEDDDANCDPLQEEDVGDLELPDDLKLEEGDDGAGGDEGDDVDSNDGSDGDAADEPQDVEGEGDDADDDGEGEDENAPVELEELEQEV